MPFEILGADADKVEELVDPRFAVGAKEGEEEVFDPGLFLFERRGDLYGRDDEFLHARRKAHVVAGAGGTVFGEGFFHEDFADDLLVDAVGGEEVVDGSRLDADRLEEGVFGKDFRVSGLFDGVLGVDHELLVLFGKIVEHG